MAVCVPSAASTPQRRFPVVPHPLYGYHYYDHHIPAPQILSASPSQETKLQKTTRKRHSTTLYAHRDPAPQNTKPHNKTVQRRSFAADNALHLSSTTHKEEHLRPKEAGNARRTPGKVKSMGWHQDMIHLRQTTLVVLNEVRHLAEELIEAERQNKVWQKRHLETQERLKLATAKNALLCHELERTELLLYEAEIRRSALEKSVHRCKGTSGTRGALNTSRSLPLDIARFLKLSRV